MDDVDLNAKSAKFFCKGSKGVSLLLCLVFSHGFKDYKDFSN